MEQFYRGGSAHVWHCAQGVGSSVEVHCGSERNCWPSTLTGLCSVSTYGSDSPLFLLWRKLLSCWIQLTRTIRRKLTCGVWISSPRQSISKTSPLTCAEAGLAMQKVPIQLRSLAVPLLVVDSWWQLLRASARGNVPLARQINWEVLSWGYNCCFGLFHRQLWG